MAGVALVVLREFPRALAEKRSAPPTLRDLHRAGYAVIVPAGANHNIINTGSVPLKLYTIYAPPNHRDAVVHHTRDEAEADNEQFDGKTTE